MSSEEFTQKVTLKTKHEFALQADLFTAHYKLLSTCEPYSNKQFLTKPSKRYCRFCMKPYGETRFKSAAHLFPHFLGNKSYYSDFECDSCNSKFSSYENHLANYLGAERTMFKSKGKGGVPKFKTNGNTLQISVEDYEDKEAIEISRTAIDDDSFHFDREKQTVSVSFYRNSYIPNLAYKSLLKIALSVLPEKESESYVRLKKYLTEPSFGTLEGCLVIPYILPFGAQFTPKALVFKRKSNAAALTHNVCLYFLNHILWIPLPLNEDDMNLFNTPLNIIQPPPFFFGNDDLSNIKVTGSIQDWSSLEMRKREEQAFIFTLNGASAEQALDNVEASIFNHPDIKSLIILPNGDAKNTC